MIAGQLISRSWEATAGDQSGGNVHAVAHEDAIRRSIMQEAFGDRSAMLRIMPQVSPAGAPLPFRAICLEGPGQRVLVTNDAGEFVTLSAADFDTFVTGRLGKDSAVFPDLAARHLLLDGRLETAVRLLATKVRTRKAFLQHGAALHILVPTLRCHQSCLYCQVSRRPMAASGFDMTPDTALMAVDRILESDSPELTVEFQGGEPLLAFNIIQLIVNELRKQAPHRQVTFSLTSTLHHLTEDMAEFFAAHDFQISASLDGPEDLHDANRPVPGGSAAQRTMTGVRLARKIVGARNVAAITTITKHALNRPEEVVDALVRADFHSLFLRPLSPYGFALRSARRIGYTVSEFQAFYERALSRILWWNGQGVAVEEAYAAILLSHILTPFHSGYVDLRSPAGAGLGVLAYDYDGSVYVSDEGRMLAAAGDPKFRMGSVCDPMSLLLASEAMRAVAAGGVAEEQPGCRECAFLPYCGADPVHHYAAQGDVRADRLSSDFCRRHMALFQMLFGMLLEGDPSTRAILTNWSMRRFVAEAA